MTANFLITIITLMAFSMSAQAIDSVETVASLSCSFERKLVKADLKLVSKSYQLNINSDNASLPSFQYKATSIRTPSKLFVFKGFPKKSDELTIDIVLVEKNNPGRLCGAVQLIDSSRIIVDGALGCCTYIKKPSKEISFEIGQ